MEDLIQNLRNKKFQIELPSHLWRTFDVNVLSILQTAQWKTFKYFSSYGTINSAINSVDNKKGGIYIFYVDPQIIPERQRILMYVGEAHITDNQNLRKRISEYKGYLPPDYRRPKIRTMLEQWWEDLYCSYIELDDNALIMQIESELINKLILPFNDKIPDKKIGFAAKAAGLQ